MNISEDMRQSELSFTDNGNVKWNQVRKSFDSFL